MSNVNENLPLLHLSCPMFYARVIGQRTKNRLSEVEHRLRLSIIDLENILFVKIVLYMQIDSVIFSKKITYFQIWYCICK